VNARDALPFVEERWLVRRIELDPVIIPISFRAHQSKARSTSKALETFLSPVFIICEWPPRIVANNNLIVARKYSRSTEQDLSHSHLQSAIGWEWLG
jgi:hypothetical protein